MHTLGATAVIINDGQVLLTRCRDYRLWVAPGGHLEQGETVQACCLREVWEETGLEVEIKRLVGLYVRRRVMGNTTRSFTFLFACRVVGGACRVTDETAAIRYWPLEKLPVNMPSWHRRYVIDTLEDQTTFLRELPMPLWVRLGARPAFLLRRLINRVKGKSKFKAARWEFGAFVTLFDDDGRVLLVRRRDYPVWNLPGGKVKHDELPWNAAVRETREETGLDIRIERLTGIYSKPLRGVVVLSFEGCIVGGQLVATEEGAESCYFSVDALPESTLPKHIERIRDSAAHSADVVFRVQDTPPGLQMLGFT